MTVIPTNTQRSVLTLKMFSAVTQGAWCQGPRPEWVRATVEKKGTPSKGRTDKGKPKGTKERDVHKMVSGPKCRQYLITAGKAEKDKSICYIVGARASPRRPVSRNFYRHVRTPPPIFRTACCEDGVHRQRDRYGKILIFTMLDGFQFQMSTP